MLTDLRAVWSQCFIPSEEKVVILVALRRGDGGDGGGFAGSERETSGMAWIPDIFRSLVRCLRSPLSALENACTRRWVEPVAEGDDDREPRDGVGVCRIYESSSPIYSQ